MALSGSVETSAWTAESGSKWKVVLNWTATQSIANNTSTISWNLKASTASSGYVVISELRVKIAGTEVYYRSHSEHTNGYNGTQLASGTTTISHNNDGTKSVEMSVEAGIYNWAINKSGSSTFSLDTIPRASSISSAGAVTLGNACSVAWTPLATSFYYKLKFSIGSWSNTTSAIHPNQTSSYTYTGYTIPLEAANQVPNSTTGTMTVTLYSYSNSACSTQIGSASSKTFTITIPSSVKPTISSVTATIDNSANSVVNSWGLAVVGYTKVKVEAAASGSYSSTISSFTISGGYSTTRSGTSLSYTGGKITSSGSKTFSVTCKDSRGRTSSAVSSSAITFYAYAKPSISKFSVARNAGDSTKVTVNANWSFSSVNGKNSTTATLYYKKSNTSSWSKYGTIARNTDIVLTTAFEDISSYNFKIVVTDALSQSAQEESFISTLEVLLDFRAGGKGLGIGKICESDSMEVSLDAKFFGAIYIGEQTLEDYIKSLISSA